MDKWTLIGKFLQTHILLGAVGGQKDETWPPRGILMLWAFAGAAMGTGEYISVPPNHAAYTETKDQTGTQSLYAGTRLTVCTMTFCA